MVAEGKPSRGQLPIDRGLARQGKNRAVNRCIKTGRGWTARPHQHFLSTSHRGPPTIISIFRAELGVGSILGDGKGRHFSLRTFGSVQLDCRSEKPVQHSSLHASPSSHFSHSLISSLPPINLKVPQRQLLQQPPTPNNQRAVRSKRGGGIKKIRSMR